MMEHNILGLRYPSGNQTPSGEQWRPLAWPEIAARLGAASDLRRALARPTPAEAGSFSVGSARRLAALQQGIQNVNPVDSGNLKASGSTVVDIVDDSSRAS